MNNVKKTNYYVCGLGYNYEEEITDVELDFGKFSSYQEAYETFVRLQCADHVSWFKNEEIQHIKLQIELCEEDEEQICCVEVMNETDIYRDIAIDKTETKTLKISMGYTYVGDTEIQVPMELLKGKTKKEQLDIAYEYAQKHIDEIPVATNAEYIPYSDEFILEDCRLL